MTALLALTIANIRSYVRDRAALFWAFAFPLLFIFMFGFIFQGGGDSSLTLGWVDNDGSSQSSRLEAAFEGQDRIKLTVTDKTNALEQMRQGKVDAVIEVPAGYGAGVDAATAGSGGPTSVAVYV